MCLSNDTNTKSTVTKRTRCASEQLRSDHAIGSCEALHLGLPSSITPYIDVIVKVLIWDLTVAAEDLESAVDDSTWFDLLKSIDYNATAAGTNVL